MNTYLNLLNAQLTALLENALTEYDASSPKLQALKLAISVDTLTPRKSDNESSFNTPLVELNDRPVNALHASDVDEDEEWLARDDDDDDEAEEAPLPDGFTDREEYNRFLESQGVTDTPQDVAGVLVDEETGEVKEIGNFEQSAANVRQALEEIDTDDTPDPEGIFVVSYTRKDGKVLSIADVRRILNDPISAPLFQMGNIQLLHIACTDNESEKEAIFSVEDNGALPLKAFALSFVQYRGTSVFPGIGLVEARGRVDIGNE